MTIAGPFLHLLESITMWHSKVPVWVLIVATLELILSFLRWNELQIGWWSDAWVIRVPQFHGTPQLSPYAFGLYVCLYKG
jgi:hypothetical protein